MLIKVFSHRFIILCICGMIPITSNDTCYVKHTPCLSKLEAIDIPVAKRTVVVDSVRIIQAKIAFPVKVETSKTEIDIIGKFRIDISAIPSKAPLRCVYTNQQRRILIDLFAKEETQTTKSKFSVVIFIAVVIHEVRIEVYLSAELPTAKILLKHGNSLIKFVDLHAEGIEFVFEFHDELLEEFEVLLAGLFSVYRYEGARYYRGHLITGRGLCTFECYIFILRYYFPFILSNCSLM